ncbi:class I histocompatibility antigen, F10 alpha chain-like [Heterodontus francisci]|uniref:class I histocompatibility antigen, F10 alpha chain-like n=1 Tax=Heterodontus francisci TaxID=7792 RepID=UPI00355B31DE
MLLILFSISLCFSWVCPESHYLRYYYTSMLNSVNFPEFIHVGVLDGVQITYYDSDSKRDIPRQPWMNRTEEPDYWDKETLRLLDREKLSLANVQIATKRTNSNMTKLNFLQYTSGCELRDDGAVGGVRQYAFNGRDLISFDLEHTMWVTSSPAALVTKRKWNNNKADNEYKKQYTQQICIKWLRKYLMYSNGDLNRKVAPDVMVYGRKTSNGQNLNLHCLVTGFFPASINVTWLIDGKPLSKPQSTGILPNHDGTYQIRISLQTKPGDSRQHICRVEHSSLSETLDRPWDERNGSKTGIIVSIVLVIVLLCFIGAVAAVLYKYKNGKNSGLGWCLKNGSDLGSPETGSSNISQSSQDSDEKGATAVLMPANTPNSDNNEGSAEQALV